MVQPYCILENQVSYRTKFVESKNEFVPRTLQSLAALLARCGGSLEVARERLTKLPVAVLGSGGTERAARVALAISRRRATSTSSCFSSFSSCANRAACRSRARSFFVVEDEQQREKGERQCRHLLLPFMWERR